MCWILKLFYNEIVDKFDWVLHLEISSLMIIQLLTHYTKSILKSLINQLCDISRCNTQSNLSNISWLPEEKKANMWHGRGNSGGSWPPAFPRSLHTSENVYKYHNYLFQIFTFLSLCQMLTLRKIYAKNDQRFIAFFLGIKALLQS